METQACTTRGISNYIRLDEPPNAMISILMNMSKGLARQVTTQE
jgi:hypothetical protein